MNVQIERGINDISHSSMFLFNLIIKAILLAKNEAELHENMLRLCTERRWILDAYNWQYTGTCSEVYESGCRDRLLVVNFLDSNYGNN